MRKGTLALYGLILQMRMHSNSEEPDMTAALSEASSSSLYEPHHDKTNKMTCAPSKDSDQTGNPPILIRVFAVRMKKHWGLNYLPQ